MFKHNTRLFTTSIRHNVTRPITRPNRLSNATKVDLDDGAEFFFNPPPSSAEAYPDGNSVKSLNFNLSSDQIGEIKEMRRAGHSANAISRKFNCSKGLIAVVAPASKQNRIEHVINQQQQQSTWGFNKHLSRHQRLKRKEYW
ncbi:hypothetical protein E3P77_02906 [Wallemia ichthyophaga]|uniref:Uncharacterized protein n=1 Tax=Wallemia ichthyophaga TaxID=245174 RepID=A0A4T0GF38_WALIC|nr:hypothetical protein E3P91_02897 [Wallemia ichthyophaga]TIA80293.1 hypothetical protein E3P98_02791 [Wallemia ichthyophaga]TIA89055.1 hypothetical protein E3P97_03230 [Wallemia ichthyophaga]TIA96001.1 hypothetical protein E3P96_03710 [Wallemia ichthyophaga]TIA97766.1 hypothetical protein E3P95_02717 [Wallemia ichthyophaga]